MSSRRENVVVIGSGIGGAGCAALLAARGLDVTVLERNPFPGGKAASFEKDGFIYDTGVHAVGSGSRGPLGEINRMVGGRLEFNLIEAGNRIAVGGYVSDNPMQAVSDEAVLRMLRDIGVGTDNVDDCFACFKELISPKPAQEMAVLDELSLYDYVARFTDDANFHQMVNAMCALALVLTYYQGSAGEFIYSLAGMAGNASLSYPRGGMGAVASAYLEALERMGGKVEFGRPVEGILVEDGRVVGVEAGGRIPAGVVVSNMGLQPTVRMVADCLPGDYVTRAMSLRSSYGGVTVKYALDEKVLEQPLTLWVPDAADSEALEKYAGVFYPVPSLIDPGLVPEGCQLVLAGAVVQPHLKHSRANEMVLDRIEATMRMLHPEIEEHIVWKIRTNTDYTARISGRELGEVVGLAQDYRQVGKNRPDPRMPVKGLYLVGADAGGRGIGTEMAGESAINVSAMIEKDWGQKD